MFTCLLASVIPLAWESSIVDVSLHFILFGDPACLTMAKNLRLSVVADFVTALTDKKHLCFDAVDLLNIGFYYCHVIALKN